MASISDIYPAKVHLDKRRISVGVNDKNEELTMTLFKRKVRPGKGATMGADAYYSRVYVGLSHLFTAKCCREVEPTLRALHGWQEAYGSDRERLAGSLQGLCSAEEQGG